MSAAHGEAAAQEQSPNRFTFLPFSRSFVRVAELESRQVIQIDEDHLASERAALDLCRDITGPRSALDRYPPLKRVGNGIMS